MGDGWIVIPNWDKFQYRGDRELVWIKLYLQLRSRDEWRQLTFSARGLLVSIWVEYAASHTQLRSLSLPSRLGQKIDRRTFDSLLQAGFVQVSGAPPAPQGRPREEEEETASKEAVSSREEKWRPPQKSGATSEEKEKIRRKAKFWIDTMIHELEGVDLAYVIADEFRIDDQDLVADLIAYAQERMLGRTL